MTNSLSVGLALAAPVLPDVLGERLEAYAKVIPVLRTLRLCHRYGQDPHAHITKLPAEIELAIEDLIVKAQQRPADRCYGEWRRAFRHYEGRCAPMDHLEDAYSPLSDQASDYAVECSSCTENYYWHTEGCETRCKPQDSKKCWTCSQELNHETCMATSEAKLHHNMNDLALDWDYEFDIDDDCEGWLKNIDKKGDFAQFEKVLREQFGLEVFFSSCRIAKEDEEHWPRNINHHWHHEEELKTTICYLTISTQLAQKTYEISEREFEVGGAFDGTQAVTIKQGGSNDSGEARKRFHHAMNILRLRPYLHPSQRNSLMMPSCGVQEDAKELGGEDAMTWPQLVVFAKSSSGILLG